MAQHALAVLLTGFVGGYKPTVAEAVVDYIYDDGHNDIGRTEQELVDVLKADGEKNTMCHVTLNIKD